MTDTNQASESMLSKDLKQKDKEEWAKLQAMTDDEQTVYILTDIINQETIRHQEMLERWREGERSLIKEARRLGGHIREWTKRRNAASQRLEESGLSDRLKTYYEGSPSSNQRPSKT